MERPKIETSQNDYYVPEDEEHLYFKPMKNNIMVMFSNHFKRRFEKIQPFMVNKAKRGYANQKDLICAYNNYFVRYYDEDDEVMSAYLNMKCLIDYPDEEYTYGLEEFIEHIYKYLFSDTVIESINRMVEELYFVEIMDKNYDDNLKFTNRHGKIIMAISVAIKLMIPIVTHYRFVYPDNPSKNDDYLLKCFDQLFTIFDGGKQVYNKLYETANIRVKTTRHSDKKIWEMQEIRGITTDSFADDLVNTIIINVLHKCQFIGNAIVYIHKSMGYQITYMLREDFDFELKAFDTANDDDEGLSTFDKVEIRNISNDETVHIINQVNIEVTLEKLKSEYDITEEEIVFYKKFVTMNKFQTGLVFQLFAKYFGSCNQLYNITRHGYATLIAIMKKMLDEENFVYLHHLLSGEIVTSVNTRKRLNKNEIIKVHASDRYNRVLEYNYPRAKNILDKNSKPSRILSSLINTEITLVDYQRQDLLGKTINVDTNILCEDFTKYLMLI